MLNRKTSFTICIFIYNFVVESVNMAESQLKIGLLSSWKEIAAYLGRGVRTVQRYEQAGLPVRRLRHGRRSPVVAEARDIDLWLQSAQAHGFSVRQSREQLFFRGALVASIHQARLLRQELMQLRESQRKDLNKLFATIARLEKLSTPRGDFATHTPPPHRRKNSTRPWSKLSSRQTNSHSSVKGLRIN